MRNLLVAILAVLVGASVGSQEAPVSPSRRTSASSATLVDVQHDRSPALRTIAPGAPEPGHEHRRERHRPLQPRRNRGNGPGGAHLPDPVVQDTPGGPGMPAAASSFDGVENVDGVLPPDPNGAVGPNHYVQWVNTSFAIFDKTGTLLYGPAEGNTLWAGFGGPCEEDNEGDPIVLHDHLADRWLMSQLALPNFPFGPFYQCVAVSETADPLGAYHRYAFVVSDTKLNDYPKLAVWPDAYYLTVNQFDGVTSEFLGQGVLAFERDAMLAGGPARLVYLDLEAVDPDLGGMLPADMDGPPPPAGSPAYFVQFDDDAAGVAPQDQLQLWRFHVDWNDPEASTFSGPAILPTAPFDSNMCGYSRNCIPQAGTRRRVDAISDRLMYRLQYRNFGTHESLVVNHTVDVGGDHAGIRWYEVRDPGGAPFIYQQGTYAPDAAHRWMGSAAMDGAGDLAIGFSVSSATQFPSIHWAGRLAGDALGVLAQGETTLIDGAGSQTDASGRWGDYSALSVDPTDNCTFWYTHEYYSATSAIDWRTRIGSFRFAACTSDLPTVSVEATVATTPENGSAPGLITVRRTGATDAALVVPYTVRGSATPGVDYVALPGSVTIPAGAPSATITVTPIDDTLIEDDETVVATLVDDPAYQIGTPSSAIVTILNDDLPPNLVVSALSVPAAGTAGASIAVTDTTANPGGDVAAASTTRFYLSTDATFSAGDVAIGDRPVPALTPGATSVATTSVTIPAATVAGTYWIIARADATAAVAEGDETDNTRASSIVIGGDLLITALGVPATTGAGLGLTLTDTTTNQGPGGTSASTTRFYLSSNSTFDAADVPLGARAVPALAAGAASSGTTTVTIPAATPAGVYFVLARADADGVVSETNEVNNTSARQVVVGPDLVVATWTVPATAAPGVPFIVSDTIRNQGGGAAGASTTRFYLSTNSLFDAGDVALGSRAVPALAPGASSTGSTTLTLPSGTAVGSYWILIRADADAAVGETGETNNTAAVPVQVGADLLVSAFAVPATAGAGLSVAVTDTTTNQGSGPAGASTTRFYLSADSTLDGGDAPLGARAVPALGPGAASSGTTVLTIPAATAAGAYFVIARADADGAVTETSETNNTTVRVVQIGPDLVVATWSVPGTAAPGVPFTVTDTIRNQGGGTAGASTTRFYLSTNTALDAGDVALGGRAVPALAPGASNAGPTTLTLPADTGVGSYFLLIAADGDGTVPETQETNDTAAVPLRVGPDLVVSALTVPGLSGAGVSITVTDSTTNQGSGPAGASTTRFYLSTDSTLDAGDLVLASRAVPALAPGGASSATTTLAIPPATAAGTYWVIARADADDAVGETSEANNTSVRVVQIGPDLIVATWSVPATAAPGVPFTVSDTTRNQGGGTAGASTTRFFLSTDAVLDAGDVPLGSRAVPALAPNATSAGPTTLTLPAGTAVGSYFLLIRADADAAVSETVETNDTAAVPLQIGPDLAVSVLTVPPTTGAGAAVTVSDTTTNQGSTAAGPSTTRFYLSTNAVVDAGDVILGSRAVPALAPSASSSATTGVVVPADTATGTYFVIARADADDALGETSEVNNTSVRVVQVGPDLIVATWTIPATAAPGTAITVTDTVANQGGGAAGASTARYYLSTNALLDGADVPLGARAVPALPPGGSSTATTSLTIPAGTAAGSYFLLIVPDADGAVAETQEGNGTGLGPVRVGP